MSAPAKAPHLLYVAWGFPPARSGGVYRALATANEFAARGWRVTVAAADPDATRRYLGADPSLEAMIDPRITLVRVPFHWVIRDTDLRTYSRTRVMLGNRIWGRLRSLRDQRIFPEANYAQWRPDVERAVEEIHAADPVDLTIATANPHIDFQAAHHLNTIHGVPFVMDYRDAWRLDVFSGATLQKASSRIGKLERRFITDAHEVWFVNEPIRSWHVNEYPAMADRMHVVENGWDAAFVGTREVATQAAADSPLTFGYLGTITPKVPLEPLMRGWVRAKAEGLLPEDARLKVAGYLGYFATPRGDLAATLDSARDAGVEFVGQVQKATVADFYAGLDVLVLALGEGRYVTSGKVYEYMATGKTIASIHAPENNSTDVLRDYPLHVAVEDLSDAAIAATLGRAATRAQTATPEEFAAALAAGGAVRRDLQLDERVSALSEEFTP